MDVLGKTRAIRPGGQRDIPNYKALPLRRSFLAVLFVFVCSLLVALEYLLRKLPNEHDRSKIPNDTPYMPTSPAKKRRGTWLDKNRQKRDEQTTQTIWPRAFILSHTQNFRTHPFAIHNPNPSSRCNLHCKNRNLAANPRNFNTA